MSPLVYRWTLELTNLICMLYINKVMSLRHVGVLNWIFIKEYSLDIHLLYFIIMVWRWQVSFDGRYLSYWWKYWWYFVAMSLAFDVVHYPPYQPFSWRSTCTQWFWINQGVNLVGPYGVHHRRHGLKLFLRLNIWHNSFVGCCLIDLYQEHIIRGGRGGGGFEIHIS